MSAQMRKRPQKRPRPDEPMGKDSRCNIPRDAADKASETALGPVITERPGKSLLNYSAL